MTFRAATGVLAQPIQRLSTQPGVFSAIAAAILSKLRPSGTVRPTTSRVSATWLADLKRHSIRYRD